MSRAPRLPYCSEVSRHPTKRRDLPLTGVRTHEGTGQYGRSRLKKWSLDTGKVESVRNLGARDFGEGAVALNDRLYQLSYISNTCFVYDPGDLSPVRAPSLSTPVLGHDHGRQAPDRQ